MLNKKVLYPKIEDLIIRWNIDGTKTAGHLTRQIIDLLNEKQYIKTIGVLCDNIDHFLEYKKGFNDVSSATTPKYYFYVDDIKYKYISRNSVLTFIHGQNFNEVIFLSELTEEEKNSEWYIILKAQICTKNM